VERPDRIIINYCSIIVKGGCSFKATLFYESDNSIANTGKAEFYGIHFPDRNPKSLSGIVGSLDGRYVTVDTD
jgi:hypothetical protein